MNEVLSFSSASLPSHGQLLLEWVGEGQPGVFSELVKLEGSVESKSLRIRYPPLSTQGMLILSYVLQLSMLNCYSIDYPSHASVYLHNLYLHTLSFHQ